MLASAILVIILFILVKYIHKRRYRLPPGPRGRILVGSAWDIPKEFEWETYERWSREFNSDIIHFRIFQTDVVVLNSVKVVQDLLEKRSNIYSDRVDQVMLLKLVGWNRNFGFMPYGDNWRDHRRYFHQAFYPNAVIEYRPRSSKEAKKLLISLISKPNEFMDHVRMMAGSLILGIVYGFDIQPENDPWVNLAERALKTISAVGSIGTRAVDYVPYLQYIPEWFPGAQFKRDAAEWKKDAAAMFEKPFEFVKNKMAAGTVEPSILTSLLSTLDPTEDNSRKEEIIQHITGSAYLAGADTIVSSIQTFILAMVLYPEVQKAAQAEIDRVVGGSRLPTYEDRDDLPYITAVLRETWRNVTPLALPHRLREDDEYNGYHLPAGCIVLGNVWTILHNEAQYPNPDVFDPTRYLTADGKLDANAPNPMDIAFGFGRRICPGRYFAIDSMWITMTYILATLNIETAMDANGGQLKPTAEYTSGLMSYPIPFNASFSPRSEAALALIRDEDALE